MITDNKFEEVFKTFFFLLKKLDILIYIYNMEKFKASTEFMLLIFE